jgi:hypothetical protein
MQGAEGRVHSAECKVQGQLLMTLHEPTGVAESWLCLPSPALSIVTNYPCVILS